MRLCYIVLSLPAVIAFHVAGTSAECSPEEAELKAAEYGKRFDSEAADFRRTSTGSDSLMMLCIEKLNGSETSAAFWNSTNSCLPEEVDYIIQQWNETEKDVNSMCTDACPRYAFFLPSARVADMAALTDGRYNDFCRSMNVSMAYAKGNTTNCKFGMSIYYSFLPDGARNFWDFCQLGCSDLDNSIPSIIRCYNDISGRSPTCEEHWDFKQCIYKRGDVCMAAVVKYYIDFYKHEEMCTTTTSTTSTTTIPTTTTTTSTSATTITTTIITDTTTLHVSSSGTATEEETSQVPVSSTISLTSPMTSSSDITTTPARMLNISACIREDDHRLFSKFPNLTKELIMKVLKIEACLYRLDKDPNIVKNAVANLPRSFQEMFIRVHTEGYDILSTLPECVKPKPKDVNCNGHNYGLIACSGDAPGCMKLLLFVSTLILVESYFQ